MFWCKTKIKCAMFFDVTVHTNLGNKRITHNLNYKDQSSDTGKLSSLPVNARQLKGTRVQETTYKTIILSQKLQSSKLAAIDVRINFD